MTSDDYPFWTYEELAESAYYEAQVEYVLPDTFDADYIWYPPAEYWDQTIASNV